MLLMPYLRNVIKPFIPFGVILLVAINLFVFFVLQQRDEPRYQKAFDYYAQSILVRLEPQAYHDFLQKNGRQRELNRFDKMRKREELLPYAVKMMEDDPAFMRALRANQIITREREDFGQWRQARQYFEQAMAGITVERYAFRTDNPSLLTAFTHQFLHGDTGHIVGNMIFLVLIAPAVEGLLGTGLFLAIYLIGGLGAVGMHWLVVGGGSGLVGASGAISAAMGAFAVLLRWRRIPFFYFVFVYFDIIRAPALLAFPIWVANEVVQLVWFGNGHIAYGAHIGGLLTGGLLAWPFLRRAEERLLPESAAGAGAATGESSSFDKLQEHLGQARKAMRDNAFDLARRAYLKAAGYAGGNLDVWRECLNVLKLAPGSEEYHKLTRALLRSQAGDAATHALLLEVFRDYVRLAQPRPALDAELLIRLGERFRKHGCAPELERTARLLHAVAPEHPRCPEIILAAASALHSTGDGRRAADLTSLLEGAG